MDDQIRSLQREVLENPDNAVLRFRYRSLCLREGRLELAGLEVGDTVVVTEVESPWVRGSWDGIVMRIFDAGDKYIRPVDIQNLPYRVRPSPAYVEKGLYLTREDKTLLSKPVLPPEPDANPAV